MESAALPPPRKKARVQQQQQQQQQQEKNKKEQLPNTGLAQLLSWAKRIGCGGLDNIEIRCDNDTLGAGLFASKRITAHSAVISLPQSAVLTLERAASSTLGRLARATAAEWGSDAAATCTDSFLLYVFMCVGRIDPAHPWHAYCSSLPTAPQEPCRWPDAVLDELRASGTAQSLVAAVDDARAELARAQGLLDRLVAAHPAAFPATAFGPSLGLAWARGCYVSRRFPEKLAAAPSASSAAGVGAGADPPPPQQQASQQQQAPQQQAPPQPPQQQQQLIGSPSRGCLLPVIDLMNHRHCQPMTWSADGDGVKMVVDKDVPAGEQLFNNYGSGRSNESLLFCHGFATAENLFDTVGIRITLRSAEGAVLSSTPFLLRNPSVGGIPNDLMLTLVGGDECSDPPPPEVVALLVSVLTAKLAPLQKCEADDVARVAAAASARGDARLRLMVAHLRNGHRRVLRALLTELAGNKK